MAKYIFTSYDVASKLNYTDVSKFENTTNGTVRGVSTGNLQTILTMIHKVDTASMNRYTTFYNTNKDLPIDITFGGLAYSLYFSAYPVFTPLNANMWKITAKFSGTV